MTKKRIILAIESSCDETSVAVVDEERRIMSNIVASQVKSHRRFGGVVPEVASRHHVEEILLCLDDALKEAGITPKDLTAVAVTYGPGLVGALLIGISCAKAFAWANHLPLISVNHMAGHIHSASFVKPIQLPMMALLVSGGHTELVYQPTLGDYTIIGETRDDAAGEAYDKVGRVLHLTYPAGKEIDEMAHKGQDIYHFPRGMIKEHHYDFSFSGLKSAVVNFVHNADQRGESLDPYGIAASFQASVIDVLTEKTILACQAYNVKQLVVAGGVAANQGLRQRLTEALAEHLPHVELVIPPLSLCGDNAAMIAAAAFVELDKGQFADASLNANASLSFPHIDEKMGDSTMENRE